MAIYPIYPNSLQAPTEAQVKKFLADLGGDQERRAEQRAADRKQFPGMYAAAERANPLNISADENSDMDAAE